MLIRSDGVLMALRRGRRAIAFGLWPVLIASLLTGAACPAMSAAPTTMHRHGVEHEHAAHAHHAHHETAPLPLPTGDCPHCLGGHEAGNVASVDCSVASAPPVWAPASSDSSFVWVVASYAPPAPSAVPPLIHIPLGTAPPASVPLYIRHCVLLI
ncbi:MAG: hypothetical protein ABI640_11305 [Gammaproteobacteria bacterium]